MPEIVIDRNKLESYEKELTPDKFRIAFTEISESQKFVLEKLIQFLKVYVAGKKYPQTAIDDQNAVFSERQVNDIKEIFKSALSLDSKTIDNYINAAVKDTSLKDTSIYNKDLKDLKDAIKLWSKSLIEKIEGLASTDTSRPPRNADSDRNGNAERDAPELTKFNILPKSEIAAFVSRNLNFPGLNFKAAKIFLDSNVFKNISYAFVSKSFSFRSPSGEKIRDGGPRKMRIWNPSIASIARPFIWFDNAIKYGIRSRIRSFAKKFKTSAFNFLNIFLPLSTIATVVKFGYKFARIAINVVSKTIGFVYTVASKLISVIVSTVGFIVKTAYRIGSFAIKFLYGSIKKVAQLKATKLLVKGALAFFKSYPGAYLLGFIVGRIYGRIKSILGLAGETYEKIKEAFNATKEYFETNIYNPYIAKIIDKIVTGYLGVKDFVEFYFNLFVSLMEDPKDSPLKNLQDALDVLAPKNRENGESFISLSHILSETTTKMDKIKVAIDSIDADTIKNFAIKHAAAGFGSIVGTRLGAAIGQAIIPIPVVGAVIGALLGGWGGEKLGRWIGEMITATSTMTGVQSEESEVEKYIRTVLGRTSEYNESSFSRPSAAGNVQLLRTLGKKAASKKDFDIENSAEVKELSKKYGIDIWADFNANGGKEIKGTIKQKAAFIKKLEMFERIDKRLSYNLILKDIDASLKTMHKLMDTSGGENARRPRGFLQSSQVNDDKYWETGIHLGEEDKISLRDKFVYNGASLGGSGLNPFWLKIARDIVILNNLRRLSANQISPFAFLKIFEMDEKNNQNIEYSLFNYLPKSLAVPIYMTDTNGKKKDEKISLRQLITGTYFNASGGLFYDEASRLLSESSLRMDGMIGYFPLDTDWRVFSKRLMQDLDFSGVVSGTAEQYNAQALQGFSLAFDAVQAKRFGKNENAEKYDENAIAFNVFRRLGQDAANKWAQMSEEEKKELVEESMRAMDEHDTPDFYVSQKSYSDVFSKAMSTLKSASESELSDENLRKSFKDAIDKAAKNNGEVSLDLASYSDKTRRNNEFIRNELIPALEYLVREKGANKKQLLALFNLSDADIPADSPLADTVGDTASPKAED